MILRSADVLREEPLRAAIGARDRHAAREVLITGSSLASTRSALMTWTPEGGGSWSSSSSSTVPPSRLEATGADARPELSVLSQPLPHLR